MIAQEGWIEFMEAVARWSIKNQEFMSGKEKSLEGDELQTNFMKVKYLNIIRDVFAKLSNPANEKNTPKLIQLFN